MLCGRSGVLLGKFLLSVLLRVFIGVLVRVLLFADFRMGASGVAASGLNRGHQAEKECGESDAD